MTGSRRPTVEVPHRGFTLLEMAVVLLIVSILLGGMLPTISGQVQQRRMGETLAQLNDIQQALLGFAVVNGRLPCPATSTSNGVESPVGGGNCSSFSNGSFLGYVPAATLGISPTDSQGYAIDSWGNRIRYAVSSWNSTTPSVSYVFTSASGISNAIAGTTGFSNLAPNLYVCSTATGISGTACAAGTSLTSNGVPAVLISTGLDGGVGATGLDETANLDNNKTFVSHVPAPGSAANGMFDDLVVWMSTNTLVNRMVAAGKLP